MKKLYYLRTNAYDAVVSVDQEGNCKYTTQTTDFPNMPEEQEAKEFLKEIWDDSSWNDDLSKDDIFKDAEVIAVIDSSEL